MDTPLCLRCTYLEQEETETRIEGNRYGLFKYNPNEIDWYCRIRYMYIHKRPKHCIEFQPLTQTKWIKGENNMVKIGDIPSEGEKLDLAQLPKELIAIATGEKMQEAAGGKTGGLVISYKLKNGQTFNQKYSKMSGAVLAAALKRLKLDDTLNLQDAWYKYQKTDMRMGFPRMIPVEKVKEA
jgi:hypothetical protein